MEGIACVGGATHPSYTTRSALQIEIEDCIYPIAGSQLTWLCTSNKANYKQSHFAVLIYYSTQTNHESCAVCVTFFFFFFLSFKFTLMKTEGFRGIVGGQGGSDYKSSVLFMCYLFS